MVCGGGAWGLAPGGGSGCCGDRVSRSVVVVCVGGAWGLAPGGGSGCCGGWWRHARWWWSVLVVLGVWGCGGSGRLRDLRRHARWWWSVLVALCVGLPVVIRGVERCGDANARRSALDRVGTRGISRGTARPCPSRTGGRCASALLSRVTRSGSLQSSRERHPLALHAGPTSALVVAIRAQGALGQRRRGPGEAGQRRRAQGASGRRRRRARHHPTHRPVVGLTSAPPLLRPARRARRRRADLSARRPPGASKNALTSSRVSAR